MPIRLRLTRIMLMHDPEALGEFGVMDSEITEGSGWSVPRSEGVRTSRVIPETRTDPASLRDHLQK